MDKEDANRLKNALMGKPQGPRRVSEADEKILPLREMTEGLRGLPDEAFGLYAWSREPLNRKVSKEKQLQYIVEADKCGRREALLMKEEFGSSDPKFLAEKLGITVKSPDFPNGGGTVTFAQYVEPDEVTIFMDTVKKAGERIAEENLSRLLGDVEVYDLLLAHEIFHYVEFEKTDEILTQTEKIELWRKPFSNKSRLICLSEMAGMAFARELMGLAYSPYLFDVLLMYSYNKAAATSLYEEMMSFHAVKKVD